MKGGEGKGGKEGRGREGRGGRGGRGEERMEGRRGEGRIGGGPSGDVADQAFCLKSAPGYKVSVTHVVSVRKSWKTRYVFNDVRNDAKVGVDVT